MQSENIVVSSPMSFSGSAQRISKLSRDRAIYVKVPVWILIVLVWALLLVWNVAWIICTAGIGFGYRIIRRGQRKRKLEDARHRELVGR